MELLLSYNRESCFMVHPALGKHCWLGLWLITLIVLSSGFLVQSWFRNTLGKALEWLENFSSWPGLFDLLLCILLFILFGLLACYYCHLISKFYCFLIKFHLILRFYNGAPICVVKFQSRISFLLQSVLYL